MSFLPPEEQNTQGPSGTTTANPVAGMPPPTSGGSTGAGSGAPKAGAAPSSGTPTQFGSSSSKLGDYLTANAPQITSEAANIAGNLNTGYNQIGSDINNAVGQFGSQVQGGYTAPNQDIVNQAASNPTAFVGANPNNVSAFQGQYNDQYTGPQNFESTTPYSNIQNEVNTAVTDAQQFQTPAGLQNYLAGTQTNPTQASTTLDQLLIQGNPQAEQQVNSAAGQYANLTPTFANATQGADASVSAAQQAAQQAQQYAQNTFNPVQTGFGNTLNSELQNAQNVYSTETNNNQALQSAINNNGSLTPDQAQALGIDPAAYQTLQNEIGQYTQFYGTSPVGSLGQYLTPGTPAQGGPPTLANVATAPQYQEANALSQLLGQGYTSPLDQSTLTQAGTANQGYNPASFNLANAQNDVKNNFLNTDARYAASFNPQSGGAFQGVTGYSPQAQQDAQWALKYMNPVGSRPNWQNQQYIDILNQLASGNV